MGKSSSHSCLKIIACGSDSTVEDDTQPHEVKGSSDKRGWSFRNRSSRRRVLSNCVITESQTPAGNTAVSEKVVALEQQDEKPQPEQQDEKSLPPLQVEPKSPTPLESKMLKTIEAPKSPAVIKPELHESVDAQAEPPRSVESVASETVVETSSEPPASVETEEYETVVAATTEPADPKITETVFASQEDDHNVIMEEPSAVVIQSGVRGFLAQRELWKLVSIVKLQAAIRGHLVRRHAVESLYYFQGMVKVQSLVCGRQLNLLGEEASANKPFKTQTSEEKLLSISFARQLLDSTPKSKSTTINCDPMEPSSARTWLERWMNVFSSDLLELPKSESRVEEAQNPAEEVSSINEGGNMRNIIAKSLESEISFMDAPSSFLKSESSFKDASSSTLISEPSFKDTPDLPLNSEPTFKDPCSSFLNSKISFKDASTSFDDENNSACYAPAVDNSKCSDLLSSREKKENSSFDYNGTNPSCVEPSENVAALKHPSNQLNSTSQTESGPILQKNGEETEKHELSVENSSSTFEQSSADDKRFAHRSRKASNPSFIAAHSKFEELSSSLNSGGSLSLPCVDNGIDSHVDAHTSCSPAVGSASESKDSSAIEISTLDDSRVQIGGSECGTELSVTSTLDSPDQSEARIRVDDLELKFMRQKAGDVISKDESFEQEANGKSSTFDASDLSPSTLVQHRVEVCETDCGSASQVIVVGSALQMEESNKVAYDEEVNGKYVEQITASESSPPQMEEKPEIDSSEKNQMETTGSHMACNDYPSPMASLNSHVNIVESQEMASSQVSVQAKKSKIGKSGSHSHPRSSSISADKRSSHNPNHDSSARCISVEHSLNVQKSGGKRRNSFGSTELDNNTDQEPRDSTSSIKTLPSYMQATESARAKAHSPRSSPDMQENRDMYAKKRHSLPGVSGRQGSPCVQRSSSQGPQQPTKANSNTPTSQERRWVR